MNTRTLKKKLSLTEQSKLRRLLILCASTGLVLGAGVIVALRHTTHEKAAATNYFATIATTTTKYYVAQAKALGISSSFQDNDIATRCIKTYSDTPYGNQAPSKSAQNDLTCGITVSKELSVNLTPDQAHMTLQRLASTAKQEGFVANTILTNATRYSAKGGPQDSCDVEAVYSTDNESMATDLAYSLRCGEVTKTVPSTYYLQSY